MRETNISLIILLVLRSLLVYSLGLRTAKVGGKIAGASQSAKVAYRDLEKTARRVFLLGPHHTKQEDKAWVPDGPFQFGWEGVLGTLVQIRLREPAFENLCAVWVVKETCASLFQFGWEGVLGKLVQIRLRERASENFCAAGVGKESCASLFQFGWEGVLASLVRLD